MARDYGRISTGFWNHRKIRSCSDQAKLLATYLVSGPHSNACGAYLLPDAYVADDMGWSAATVSKAFAELFKIGFAVRFSDGRHIVICDFLDWNPVENENVGKAVLKQVSLLPEDQALSFIANGLKKYAKHFPNGFGTVLERFRNIEPNRTEPEPEPDRADLAGSAVADEQAALQAYNSLAEEVGWPTAQLLTPKRRSALKARLSECGGIEGWQSAMAKARASPFLRGEAGRSKGHEKWVPDFDFFTAQSKFTALMEGKYDDRDSNQAPSGFSAVLAGGRAAAIGN